MIQYTHAKTVCGKEILSVRKVLDGQLQVILYSELQDIKQQILGDVDAVMVFPQSKNNIDNANEYHLIVLEEFNFGLHNYENFQYEFINQKILCPKKSNS